MIRGLGTGLLVALVAAIASTPASGADSSSSVPGPTHEIQIGLLTNAQGNGPDLARELDQVPPGTKWLREDLEWRVVEPRQGEFDWSRYDLLFREAAERGIRILPGLGSDPLWLGFAGSWNPFDHLPSVPDERLAFAEFAGRVAARYGPGGSFWLAHPDIAQFAPREFEIWNEPYFAKAAGGDPDGGAYAELLRAASGAMKAVNPDVRIGLDADWAPAGDIYGRSTFIDDMFARVPDLGSYYDFVSVHPYTDGSPPDDPDGGYGFPRIGWVRALLLAHGAPERPFWITEIGWSTCDPVTEDSSCVSEETQAQYLEQAIDLARSPVYDYVKALFVYRRIDLDYPDDPKESDFGIEHLDGSPKPAYDVFERAVGG